METDQMRDIWTRKRDFRMSATAELATRLKELAPGGLRVNAQIIHVARLLGWPRRRTRKVWYEDGRPTVEEWLDVEWARGEFHRRQTRRAALDKDARTRGGMAFARDAGNDIRPLGDGLRDDRDSAG